MNKQLSLFGERRDPGAKPKGYVNREQKHNKSIHIDVKGEAAVRLDLYCRLNNLNLTAYVNALVEKDMAEKYSAMVGK